MSGGFCLLELFSLLVYFSACCWGHCDMFGISIWHSGEQQVINTSIDQWHAQRSYILCEHFDCNLINQSIKIYLYRAICRKRIRGACWAGLGRAFMFAVAVSNSSVFRARWKLHESDIRYPTVVRQWVPDRCGTNTEGFRW